LKKQLRNGPSVSPYITPAGQKQLSDELSHLWKIKRPQVTQAVAEGDFLQRD
jgi:transcription elongation factor GreB